MTPEASPLTLIASSAVGAVDDDAVGRAVAGGPAEGAGEVDVHVGDVGSGEVVDGDDVGAAEGVEVDPLDAGGVHRDVAGVAEEREPVSVGGQVDVLGDVGAVEEHRVGAVLAFDRVAAVARIPDERVVAGTQQGQVVAAVAVDRVVPVAAEQRLAPRTAGDRVVSVSTGDRRRDAVGEDAVAFVDAHEVVAGARRRRRSLATLLRAEAEVGRAVVTDVDLENAGLAGLQAKRDLVARFGALDRQHAVLELRVLEPGFAWRVRGLVGVAAGRGIPRAGHDPGCDGARSGRQPPTNRRPHGARLLGSNEVLHGVPFGVVDLSCG